jgi:hypothetical protein
MTGELSRNARIEECIKRINELWYLHEPEAENTRDPVLCLALVVDRRYVDDEGLELRLGVSFGGNPFLPNVPRGFVPPPILPGKCIFGIHLVGTRGDKIALYDRWYDARPAADDQTVETAFEIANSILRDIPDSEYARGVSSTPRNPGKLQLSDQRLVEEFEIVPGESL